MPQMRWHRNNPVEEGQVCPMRRLKGSISATQRRGPVSVFLEVYREPVKRWARGFIAEYNAVLVSFLDKAIA